MKENDFPFDNYDEYRERLNDGFTALKSTRDVAFSEVQVMIVKAKTLQALDCYLTAKILNGKKMFGCGRLLAALFGFWLSQSMHLAMQGRIGDAVIAATIAAAFMMLAANG